jgi:hypothetical protein
MREAQKPRGGRRTGETVVVEAGSAHNTCDSTDPFVAIRLILWFNAVPSNADHQRHFGSRSQIWSNLWGVVSTLEEA